MAETPDYEQQEVTGLLRSVLREVEGINKHLARVNGRLDRQEDAIAAATIAAAELKVKVSNLNHEVFERGESRTDATTAALLADLQTLIKATTSGDNRPAFTVGDVNVVTKLGRLAWAAMGLLGGAGLVYWAQAVIP